MTQVGGMEIVVGGLCCLSVVVGLIVAGVRLGRRKHQERGP
ncbi:hypothetical protein [Pyxidicoccus fallax]|nr:hypothetical protein [Pyxidicoccus fallax]